MQFTNNSFSEEKKIKICFVALNIFPLLSGDNIKNIIGPDVHQLLIAEELLKHNFEITFITYGKKKNTILNDFNIVTIGEFHGNSNPLYLILKIMKLFSAIIDVNANIYFFAGGTPGLVSLACKLTQHKIIYHISSDAIIDNNIITKDINEFKRHPLSVDRIGNWLDIKISDVLIVQNNFQKNALKNKFNKNSTLIKMPSQSVDPRKIVKAKPPIVLWVGSIAEVKQPEIFLRLAEAIPEAKFQIIGGYSGCQMLYDSIKNKSKDLSNLEFCGVIPLDKINTYFGNASILVNTSLFEGFPNSFIQAWMNYTPVISLNADPDEIICNYALGFHSKTFDQMVKDIKILLKDEQLRLKMGNNGRIYAESEHDIKEIIHKYVKVFRCMGK